MSWTCFSWDYKQINENSAEMHICPGLVFSYYVYGEVDILFTACIDSVTVITDCMSRNARAQHG